MSRSLQDLHPEIHWRASKVIQAAREIHVPILIYRTLATFQEQEVLYAIGRTEPGKIKTNARGGESYHNYGLAFDFAVDPPGPALEWASGVDINDDKVPDYRQIGELGEDLGLQWGGRFRSIKGDYGHLQLSFGFSIHALRLLYGVGGLPRVWAEISAKNKKNTGGEKMEKVYIGTKIIAAEPMDELSFVSEIKHEIIDPGRPSRLGYKVRYEDGYISWSPKETFERAYRALNPFELSLVLNYGQEVVGGNDQEPDQVKEGPQ